MEDASSMKILIPCAGRGQRFVDAGYKEPKPFIDVLGRPMIERVIDSLGGPSAGDYIFVISREMADAGAIQRLNVMVPGCVVIVAYEQTAGAACTALLAHAHIDNNEPLLIANSDQIVMGYEGDFDRSSCWPTAAGVIFTFPASNPKWSYAAVDDEGTVWGVAEKQVISNRATCGIYWWRRGSDFVRCAGRMIEKNLRVNNEFYVCPTFNEAIISGLRVVEASVAVMHGLGDPESLQRYCREA
jgi:dTDP-glucose pyrophosphorylase